MSIFKPGDIVVAKEYQMCKITGTSVLEDRAYEVLTTGIKDTEPWHGITLKNVTGNSLKRPIFKENLFRKATSHEVRFYMQDNYGFPKLKIGDKVKALTSIHNVESGFTVIKDDIYKVAAIDYRNDENKKNNTAISINVKDKDLKISPLISSLYFKKIEETEIKSVMQDIKLEDVLPEKEKTLRERYHETMEKIFDTEAEIDQTNKKLEELNQIKFDLKKEENNLLYQIRKEGGKK